MLTKRLENLFNSINLNNDKYTLLVNDDIFCLSNLVISKLEYQLFDYLKSFNDRIIFINKKRVFFYDEKSYKSFYSISPNLLINGVLDDISLVDSDKDNKIMNDYFRNSFIYNLSFFLNQNLKSVYILDLDSFNELKEIIYSNKTNSNIFFIITDNLINIPNLKINSIIEIGLPFDDEITNILNLFYLRNGIETNYSNLKNSIKINSLKDLYDKLSIYQDICIDLKKLFNNKKENNNLNWLEF